MYFNLLSHKRGAWDTEFCATILWEIWSRGGGWRKIGKSMEGESIQFINQPGQHLVSKTINFLINTPSSDRPYDHYLQSSPFKGRKGEEGIYWFPFPFGKIFLPQGSNSLKLLYYRWIARLRGTVRLHFTNSVGIHAKMVPAVVARTETRAGTLAVYTV